MVCLIFELLQCMLYFPGLVGLVCVYWSRNDKYHEAASLRLIFTGVPENQWDHSSCLMFILFLPQCQELKHIEGALWAEYHGKERPQLLSDVMPLAYFSIVDEDGPSSEIHRADEELCYCLELGF